MRTRSDSVRSVSVRTVSVRSVSHSMVRSRVCVQALRQVSSASRLIKQNVSDELRGHALLDKIAPASRFE